jgi:hypothetical protein
MQHIAKEGRCFVVTANSMTKVSDFPPDYPPFTPEHPDRRPDGEQWEADDIVNHGGSFIADPLGTRLTEPLWDEEGIIYADLPLAAITESRVSFALLHLFHGTRKMKKENLEMTEELTFGSKFESSISILWEVTPDLMSCKLSWLVCTTPVERDTYYILFANSTLTVNTKTGNNVNFTN